MSIHSNGFGGDRAPLAIQGSSFDLLAEIEKELPLVSFRHERSNCGAGGSPSERYRDTDSIRFLKQNRLSWWSSPASTNDMEDLNQSNNIYEVVEEANESPPKTPTMSTHHYEDISDDFLAINRQYRDAKKLASTNPFLETAYDVPTTSNASFERIFSRSNQQATGLYDIPKSPPPVTDDPFNSLFNIESLISSDVLNVSLTGDQSPTLDPTSSPLSSSPSRTENFYDVPVEHMRSTPRKVDSKLSDRNDNIQTFPRTREAYGCRQGRPVPPIDTAGSMLVFPDTYDVPSKSDFGFLEQQTDFSFTESDYDVPSSGPPPTTPPPAPPPTTCDIGLEVEAPPVPNRPTPSPENRIIDLVASRPPPVPAPRQKIPPPLPPKLETTPVKMSRSSDRKFSLITAAEAEKEIQLRQSGTSLSSWYLDTEQIRNCDIPHKELTVSSEDSDPTSLPPIPAVINTKVSSSKNVSPQRSSSRRLSSAIKTVSSLVLRKQSVTTATSESWDSVGSSGDSDTPDLISLFYNSDGRKEYMRRFCKVAEGILKFFEQETSTSPFLCICVDEITLLLARRDICPQTRTTPTLFLVDVRLGNTSKSLGFTSAMDRAEFLRKVNHSFNPKCSSLQGEVWASGTLRSRLSASGEWQTVKAVLHGKEFTLFTTERDTMTHSLDLRKAKSVEWTTCAESSVTQEKLFHVLLPCRTVYLRGPSNQETNSWYETLFKAHNTYLDKSLLSEQFLNNENIPVAIEKAVNFVSAHGTDTTGVYRLAGSHVKIERLVDALKKNAWNVHLTPEEYSPHDVANALKRFLRSFDDCILTQRLYEQWMHVSRIESIDERLPRLKDLISELPIVEHSTLRFLCSHLKTIADRSDLNCMTVANLAAIFGATILFKEPIQGYLDRDPALSQSVSMAETNAGMAIAGDLIESFCFLFDVSQAIVEKERHIQSLIAKLRDARVEQRPAGDMLVGVYVYNKEWGRCINVKISPTMTGRELCRLVRGQLKLADSADSLAVFEVVCDQQLERPLHYSESVFAAVLQWTGWDQSFAKDNYLLIKRNFIFEDVINFLQMKEPLSNSTEVKFAECTSKSFKKVQIEFAKSSVCLVKEKKDKEKEKVILKDWRVEDISVYVGCEPNRKAPTKFCLSFVKKNEQVKRTRERPFLCNTLALPSPSVHTSWLASLLCALHTNLVPPEEEMPDLLCM